MSVNEIDLNPVTHITVDAIGKPGQRVFYIQGIKDEEVITLILEKMQVQSMALGVEEFLSEIATRFPNLTEAHADYDEDDPFQYLRPESKQDKNYKMHRYLKHEFLHSLEK